MTLEGARTYAMRLVPVTGGGAQATLDLGDAQGAVAVAAAFVRDGAIASGSARIDVDGPGPPARDGTDARQDGVRRG